MNQLIFHIEFLLHEHNCVIIPDFGGFVVNATPPQRDGIAAFHAPGCELVFNRDLTHNDGLLAQSYMKNGSMTFESAMQKIEQDTQDLKRQLREQRHLEMGKLGSFVMHDDKRFVYTPGAFVRPALFGLTQATLKPLIQIQPVAPARRSENQSKRGRNAAISAAAVAAVILLMFFLPVGDTTIGRQSARMISETGWMTHSKSTQPSNSIVKHDEVLSETESVVEQPAASDEMTPSGDITVQNVEVSSPKYYIVVGVYKGVESAQKTTQRLLDEGFNQTGWLERPDRIDVYAATFTDEDAAKVYLKEVHKNFPKHSDAWILKK